MKRERGDSIPDDVGNYGVQKPGWLMMSAGIILPSIYWGFIYIYIYINQPGLNGMTEWF